MSTEEREFEFYAALVHGVAAFANLLGLVNGLRKGLRFDTTANGFALIYHAWSVKKHAEAAR